ncbi:UNVERIFIED_CONTAM: hypothetical protein PYX00_003524 [Menopon gallinae]|uniref:Uncharacterized protein n=1 Tax=Menopon gallinae TaxID=328185 RepID=A0AAW2I0R8_9NEOP
MVLDVIVRKDERSRKYVEYLIHFQGWNSSWDRCVSEDYVLKDTEENRKLQKDLADKAQLQLGAYLYRRNRKKRTRTLSQKVNESSESGTNSCSSKKSQEDDETEEQEDLQTTSDDDGDEDEDDDDDNESSMDTDSSLDERIPIDLSAQMKDYLEEDYNLIHNKRKVVSLPATPTVVEILEGYVRHFGQTQLTDSGESKRRTRGRYREKREVDSAKDFESLSARLNLCKEVVDGLRIYFDFTLGQLLLYDLERSQYEEVRTGVKQYSKENRIPDIKMEPSESLSEDDSQNICQSAADLHTDIKVESEHNKSETDRKRSLRSHREPVPVVEPSCSLTQPQVTPNNGIGKLTIKNLGSLGNMAASSFANNRDSALSTSSTSSYYSPLLGKASTHSTCNVVNVKIAKLIDHNNSWKIVPQTYLDDKPQHPATVYGAIHLARLFVKLPNLLYVANQPEKENQPRLLPERKLKALIHHLQLFLAYLESKSEWFGEKHYTENTIKKSEQLL